MTQVFKDDGNVVPVTRVQAGPCVITQVKTQEKDGVQAVQVGFGSQKVFRLNKAEQGHVQGISMNGDASTTVRVLRQFRNNNDLKRGDTFTVSIFTPGEKVQVIGISKGKGFQGVVKRHHFAGGPASHGHKDNLRMPGSIGSTGPQRVLKGVRMGGHMGDDQITVKNLEIISVDEKNNELLIKGALPGARNSIVYIMTADGSITIANPAPVVEETVSTEEPVSPEVVEPAVTEETVVS